MTMFSKISKVLPQSLTNISNERLTTLVKNGLVILSVLSVIIGYFVGVVSPDIFYAIIGGIITHFFNSSKMIDLEKKIKEKDNEIVALSLNGQEESKEKKNI